jgi:hypothetical protein
MCVTKCDGLSAVDTQSRMLNKLKRIDGANSKDLTSRAMLLRLSTNMLASARVWVFVCMCVSMEVRLCVHVGVCACVHACLCLCDISVCVCE